MILTACNFGLNDLEVTIFILLIGLLELFYQHEVLSFLGST